MKTSPHHLWQSEKKPLIATKSSSWRQRSFTTVWMITALASACLILLLASLPLRPGAAQGQSGCVRTWTVDADFDEGTLNNLNHDPDHDQLQLNKTTKPFPFVNIAASARGTMIRIEVNTGQILGEYLTSPDGMGRDPSRTTVDRFGNVWVANRAEFSNGKGSVTRIGLLIGGTRGNRNPDGSFTPDPGGQYLKPPFQYNTCLDRDGDGLIKTSRGLGNILTWNNAGGTDSNGGVATAEDECIINYTRVTGTGTRTIAVDASNDVWVGGFGDRDHEKLSGVTGQPVPGTQFNVGAGGYGGLIDGHGVLWSARELVRFVPNASPPPAGTTTLFGNSRGDYGLGIDPRAGHIWQSSLFSAGVDGPCCRLYELDANGNVLNSYAQPFGAQGVVVDGNSHVWMAEIFGSQVWHLAPDPALPGRHYSVGIVTGFQGVTGVAVDANGKIWAAEINGNRASRIDPNAGPIDVNGNHPGAIDLSVDLGSGAGPYNYSDMTGFVAIGATAPSGTWNVIQDSGIAEMDWGTVSWSSREPQGTSVRVEVRAADNVASLPGKPFTPVTNGISFCETGIKGRYLEIRAVLSRDPAVNDTPILYDLTAQCCQRKNNDPGLPYAPTAEMSDQRAGSVLIYNLYTSNPSSPATENTRINITNISSYESASVHLFFVDGSGCSVADSYICLTPNQTTSFLASDFDPGVSGYVVAVAVSRSGLPVNFNCLTGDSYLKLASGHAANLPAEAVAALNSNPAGTDASASTATLQFNGARYNKLPRVLAASSIASPADGNATLLILNRIGGSLLTSAASLDKMFGLLLDDSENPYSFTFSGGCQFRSPLNNQFPRTTPRLGSIIPAGHTGWLKLWTTEDTGILGATINASPNAPTSPQAYTQGHHLHKLTLTNKATLTMPVFPPGC